MGREAGGGAGGGGRHCHAQPRLPFQTQLSVDIRFYLSSRLLRLQ